MPTAKWIKTVKTVSAEGTTITYRRLPNTDNTDITIESRKRHIPHANGIGTWDHTSYFVLKDGKELVEKYSLADAKEYAEEHYGRKD